MTLDTALTQSRARRPGLIMGYWFEPLKQGRVVGVDGGKTVSAGTQQKLYAVNLEIEGKHRDH